MRINLHPTIIKLSFGLLLLLPFLASCTQHEMNVCVRSFRVRIEVLVHNEYGSKHTNMGFSQTLSDATLFVFDADGRFIESFQADGETLRLNDLTMVVSLPPGIYQMVVWANATNSHYHIPTLTSGVSTLTDLTLKARRNEQNCQNDKLPALWHGMTSEAVMVKDQGETLIPVGLVKDTNTLTCILQDTSGKDLNGEDFNFEIIAGNGYMNYNNSLLADSYISYGAYLRESVEVTSGGFLSRSATQWVARSESNTLRLVKGQSTRFRVTRIESATEILNIDLTEYLLLVREKFAGSIGAHMGDQAYLDYEDSYNITFFLDPSSKEKDGYECTVIKINGWIIRLNDAEFND